MGNLFDKRRKNAILQGLAKGRLDLGRSRKDGDRAFDEADTIKIPAEVMEEKMAPGAPEQASQPNLPSPAHSPPRRITDPNPTIILPPAPAPQPQEAGKLAKTAYFGLDPNRAVSGKVEKKASPFAGKAPQVEGAAPQLEARLSFELNRAIYSNDYEKAKELVGRGADVNRRSIDISFEMPHTPANCPKPAIQFPLITPLELARKLNRPDFEELLKRHGAKE